MSYSKSTIVFSVFALLNASNLFPQEEHIACVSGQDIIAKSEAGQEVQRKLEAEQKKLLAPLELEEQKIKAKAEQLQKSKEMLDNDIAEFEKTLKTLSPEARTSKQETLQERAAKLEDQKRDIDRMIQLLQNKGKQVNEKLQALYQRLMNELDALVKDTIKEVAMKHNWTMVFMQESLVYAHPSKLKTEMVIDALNTKTKAANSAKKQAIEQNSSASTKSKNTSTKSADDMLDQANNTY